MNEGEQTESRVLKLIREGEERAKRPETECSFCGKRRDQVARLTAGPGNVFICDECVTLSREHIEKAENVTSVEKFSHICRFCGIRAPTSHRYCYNCGAQFME